MRKRKAGLSTIIILLALSNIVGIFKILVTAEQFSHIYSFLSIDQVKWLAVIPSITIISLVGIWRGKRWGIILIFLTFTVVLFLDVYYKVWAHALVAIVGFVLLMFFCWQSRYFFTLEKTNGHTKTSEE
jgi:hypothetical protein